MRCWPAMHAGFQSTHSLRSATPFLLLPGPFTAFQSTHSLRSATNNSVMGIPCTSVSIHALLAECDAVKFDIQLVKQGFNPRTPCGVRLSDGVKPAAGGKVSIHALLAECDLRQDGGSFVGACFNPRTPCGVRLRLTIYIVIQQRKRYFAPTSRRRPSSPSLLL